MRQDMPEWCKHEFELITGTDIGLAEVIGNIYENPELLNPPTKKEE
jgi:hypothetical protein